MSPTLRCLVGALAAVLLLLAPRGASAQGGGGFISPGQLARDHAELDTFTGCPSCHTPGGGKPDDRCMNCHDSVKEQVSTRTGFHGRQNRGTRCWSCHPDHRGRNFRLIDYESFEQNFSNRDHLDETGFPLEGAHGVLRCRQCHQQIGAYNGESKECASCHEDPHGADASKRKLLGDCETCHGVDDWGALPLAAAIFDHDSREQADYPLEGAHADVDCDECHIDMRFVPVDHGQCTDCHLNNHRADFKDQPCEDCHATPATWYVEKFDHDLTRYPLRGLHRRVDCEECHTGLHKTDKLSRRCEGCHADPHRGQFSPRDCDDCHSVDVAAFAMREFDHARTEFPLVGKHQEVSCEDCHDDGAAAVYVGLAHDDCDSCHEDAHDGRFRPTKCSLCHISDGFEVQFFDHDNTSFPHTGKHVGLDCNKCHRDFQWNGIPHESCVDCHYTKNPHRPVITADQCDDCHVTDSFATIAFDHAEQTGFDLAPAHSDQTCTTCHTYIYHFAGLDPSCTACHLDDRPWGHYDGECGACHEASQWFPGGLGGRDHEITGFALVGSHSLLPCESCHEPGRPRGEAAPSCISCHAADDPHMNMLGMACADCHGEMSWLRTTFRHQQTGWPLRGAHRLAACVDCHAAGYIGTPRECFRCHEFEASPDRPQHQGPNFQNCERCHRVYQWTPAIYPH